MKNELTVQEACRLEAVLVDERYNCLCRVVGQILFAEDVAKFLVARIYGPGFHGGCRCRRLGCFYCLTSCGGAGDLCIGLR